MINEDIAPDFNAKEISYKGYTTKNLHHSQDALNAFNATIRRAKKGLIHDSGAILRALKTTDAYMKLNDMHLQQQRAESPEEVTQWTKEHQKAAEALKTLNGEFAHHYDYWNNHRQELQLLQANASINNPLGETYMQHIINGNPFQDVLDEKKLTPAELKKREKIALAMERNQPGINKGKKYAIATAVAKRVAESSGIDEAIKGYAYSKDGGANDEGYGKYKPTIKTMHHVAIGGRTWKIFSTRDEAHRAASAVQKKYPSKSVSVHSQQHAY